MNPYAPAYALRSANIPGREQTRNRRVDVKTVREMCGLPAHHTADQDTVKIAAIGGFTPDAQRFGQYKPISS
ncbi:MAG: hypothetical protein ACREPH_10565 [Rhodanobacteraceae bacterium]